MNCCATHKLEKYLCYRLEECKKHVLHIKDHFSTHIHFPFLFNILQFNIWHKGQKHCCPFQIRKHNTKFIQNAWSCKYRSGFQLNDTSSAIEVHFTSTRENLYVPSVETQHPRGNNWMPGTGKAWQHFTKALAWLLMAALLLALTNTKIT